MFLETFPTVLMKKEPVHKCFFHNIASVSGNCLNHSHPEDPFNDLTALDGAIFGGNEIKRCT